MDPKAFYSLTYGVFVLGAKSSNKMNACITNTCMQVASDPTRVAISVLNRNLTCDIIKESGQFTLSVLDNTCPFSLIKHFGMQSGRDTDKLANFPHQTTSNGLPIITENTCALLGCKVVSKEDLGTHTLFVAEVEEAKVLSSNPPLTYSDYQTKLKPKIEIKKERKIIGWRCKICGYVLEESELPKDFECPLCGHPAEDFEPIYAEEPGAMATTSTSSTPAAPSAPENGKAIAENKSEKLKLEEQMKFYKCKICGKIIALIKDTGVSTICCGDEMVELKPGTTDAAVEKHVPVVSVSGSTVTVSVGSVTHPMEEKHYIEWIALETTQGFQMKNLKPGVEPKAIFALTAGEEVVKAYAYCNLHSLWASN